MRNPNHICSQCSHHDSDTSTGHRQPPQASILMVPIRDLRGDSFAPQNFTTWPVVNDDHWCGEFSPAISLHS